MEDKFVSSFVPGGLGEPEQKDVAAINGLSSGPLLQLKPDDVYVREMRLVGDELTSYFSRFRTKDLQRVAHQTVGKTMLFGHDKSDAGRGRFFRSEVRRLESRSLDGNGGTAHMTFARFYWPRERSDAEDLRVNIDAGVYHECSISFQFRKATCSICGFDIRDYEHCRHFPGVEYDTPGGKKAMCFYWIDEFKDVLEGSIVYAGAHPNTGFGSLQMRMEAGATPWLREVWEKKGKNPVEKPSGRVIVRGGIEVERMVV